MSRPKRVIGYARVSSALQALGTSLGDQQASIAAYAENRGLKVTKFFVEAESAIHEKFERREQMQALMRDVRAGDLVVCAKLDRWSRDPEFTYGSVRKILSAGASFYAIDDQCDPSTQEGDTMLGFRVLFAREEHKRIRLRTVGTRNLLRDRGYYVEGTPPFGYRRAKPKGYKGVEKNVLVIEPKEADLVRRMFRLCVRGKSITEIAAELHLGRKRVWHSLRSRHYLGELQNASGVWIKGPHEPLVTPDVFERARKAIEGRRLYGHATKAPAETDTWILRDLARCAHCGGKMGAAYAGPKDERRRHYYRCWHKCQAAGPQVNTQSYVPVRAVEDEVSEMIVARLVELREDLAQGAEVSGPAPDFRARREKIERRRAKHLEAHADDLISLGELRAQLTKLDEQRQAVDAEESAALRENALLDPTVRRAVLRDVEKLATAWKRATPAMKREIARRLMSEVRIASEAKSLPVWRPLSELTIE